MKQEALGFRHKQQEIHDAESVDGASPDGSLVYFANSVMETATGNTHLPPPWETGLVFPCICF